MFKSLEVKDGLPNNCVNDIYKDSKGFMWFATSSGLARFDGYNFKVFRQKLQDEHSLPDNYVLRLVEDGKGRLWVCTGADEYAIFDSNTETFNRDVRSWMWNIGVDGVPQYLLVDRHQTYWFYVAGQGLYRYREEEHKATVLTIEQAGFSDKKLTGMTECHEGILMVYDDGRVFCVDRQSMKVKWNLQEINSTLQEGQLDPFFLFVDEEEDLWIYGALGTWVYNLKRHEWYPKLDWLSDSMGHDMVTCMAQDDEGRIWLGKNQAGIEIYDKKLKTHVPVFYQQDNERGLPHNTINDLYVDPDGGMWVGTYKKGVAYYDESIYKFGFYRLGDIHCIEEADGGALWLGINDGGLMYWNPQTGEKRTYLHQGEHSLSSDIVVSLLRASDGRIWIGTFWGGLNCFDGKRFIHYRHDSSQPNSLANDNVWALEEDTDGNIWIGTLGGGLQCLNPRTGQFTTYNMANSKIASNHIASLCMTDDRHLVIGTATVGVSVINLDTHEIINQLAADAGDGRFSNFSINQVYVDSRGLVWIATRAGLIMYDPQRNSSHQVIPCQGQEEHPVLAITEDKQQTLWITSSTGMFNITPSYQETTGEYTFTSRTYDAKDGLQNCEFNQRSIKRLSSGTLVMGGLYGINTLRPENIKYNYQDPKVMFSEFLLFNEPVQIGREYNGRVLLPKALNQGRNISLAYHQNVFTVRFATDSYILPDKTRYQYRLKGFDEQWMTLSAGMRRVTYTNLAPGAYELQVKAVNSDGYVGNEVSSLQIEILPPFWLTGWAYTCYVLVLIGLVVAGVVAVQRRERNKFRLRQMEEDARKAEELNQMKFRFFTNVSHELRTPLTLILSPLEALMKSPLPAAYQDQLKMMHRNASRLLYLVNQLLDFRKNEMAGLSLALSEGDIVLFVRNLCNSFLMFSEKRQVQLIFHSSVEGKHMAFDEDKMGKIMMNLLSNAFKFTPDGGCVEVSLQWKDAEPEILEITVADNGIGISDADKEHIFDRFFQVEQPSGTHASTGSGIGLSLVRDFVALHEGKIQVSDHIGGGTAFTMSLPVRHVDAVATSLLSAENDMSHEAPVNLSGVEPEEKAKVATPKKPLVLLVDDNQDMLDFLQQQLSLYFRIQAVSSGEEACEQISSLMPDLIISDVMMPGMDGHDLCRFVKSDPHTANIPLMLLTAKQAVEDKVEGLKIGADDYVTKPFNVEVLILRMRKLIDWSRQRKVRTKIDPEPTEIAITSLDEQLVARAIQYVEDNISRSDLSVEELSQALGMSRVHLYKKLSQITGKSPLEFIRIIRLKRGAQLLRESQLNISEIAYQVGFNSPKYFTRYFKEEFGVLPSTYQDQCGV